MNIKNKNNPKLINKLGGLSLILATTLTSTQIQASYSSKDTANFDTSTNLIGKVFNYFSNPHNLRSETKGYYNIKNIEFKNCNLNGEIKTNNKQKVVFQIDLNYNTLKVETTINSINQDTYLRFSDVREPEITLNVNLGEDINNITSASNLIKTYLQVCNFENK